MKKLTLIKSTLLVCSYLFVIVVANLIVTHFGAQGLLVTALILIPFDMIARDELHEMWSGNHLKKRMFILIFSGGLISYLINKNALNIAIASSVTFLIAGFSDYIVYSLLKTSRLKRMIGSNIVSTIIDSLIFQIIAFGSFSFIVASQQSFLKITGSILWAYFFIKALSKKHNG